MKECFKPWADLSPEFKSVRNKHVTKLAVVADTHIVFLILSIVSVVVGQWFMFNVALLFLFLFADQLITLIKLFATKRLRRRTTDRDIINAFKKFVQVPRNTLFLRSSEAEIRSLSFVLFNVIIIPNNFEKERYYERDKYILNHELAHCKYYDYTCIFIFRSFVFLLFFFPIMMLVSALFPTIYTEGTREALMLPGDLTTHALVIAPIFVGITLFLSNLQSVFHVREFHADMRADAETKGLFRRVYSPKRLGDESKKEQGKRSKYGIISNLFVGLTHPLFKERKDVLLGVRSINPNILLSRMYSIHLIGFMSAAVFAFCVYYILMEGFALNIAVAIIFAGIALRLNCEFSQYLLRHIRALHSEDWFAIYAGTVLALLNVFMLCVYIGVDNLMYSGGATHYIDQRQKDEMYLLLLLAIFIAPVFFYLLGNVFARVFNGGALQHLLIPVFVFMVLMTLSVLVGVLPHINAFVWLDWLIASVVLVVSVSIYMVIEVALSYCLRKIGNGFLRLFYILPDSHSA